MAEEATNPKPSMQLQATNPKPSMQLQATNPKPSMQLQATNPKPSMRREQYCLAVHKNTCECTFECTGAERQTAEKVGFCHLSSFFLSSFSYRTLD